MAAPIGLSPSDLVAGIRLVNDIIKALHPTRGASAQHSELLSELYSLERALIEVKSLELDDLLQAQNNAMRMAACRCQNTIDEFWETNRKYQSHLQPGGSGSWVKDSWKKIQWSLCKKADLAKFTADLRGHTGFLNILLMTIHMESAKIHSQKEQTRSESISSKLQQGFFTILGALKTITTNVSGLLDRTAEVIRINLQIYQIVLEVHRQICRPPNQIYSGKPVYLLDAQENFLHFFPDFFPTKEAFLGVLKARFSEDTDMIDNNEFVLEVQGDQQAIRLEDPWETWFSPGQHVGMSMLFHGANTSGNLCPACRMESYFPAERDVECPHCGRTVRRVLDITDEVDSSPTVSEVTLDSAQFERPAKRKRSLEDGGDIGRFRRVRVIEQPETGENDLFDRSYLDRHEDQNCSDTLEMSSFSFTPPETPMPQLTRSSSLDSGYESIEPRQEKQRQSIGSDQGDNVLLQYFALSLSGQN